MDHQDDDENVTHSLILLVTDPDGVRRKRTLATASHPSTWSADTARAFLHDVQLAIGAHGMYRVSFDPGVPGPLSMLTVEADSAIAIVTPPGLSGAGRRTVTWSVEGGIDGSDLGDTGFELGTVGRRAGAL